MCLFFQFRFFFFFLLVSNYYRLEIHKKKRPKFPRPLQGPKEKNFIMIVIIISYHQDGVVYGGGGR